MEASKERNGNKPLAILEIGKTIARTASVFSSIRMEISTKACGDKISDMVRVLIGEMKAVNSEESIRVTGSRIKSMEEVRSFIRMEIDMTGIGSMECLKEKEE
jgi:hypothetical protein